MRFAVATSSRSACKSSILSSPLSKCDRSLIEGSLNQKRERRMRKQYHFRPSAAGLRAWDVDRLVASSKNFEVLQVPLTSIREIDEAYWGQPMTCRDVAE